MNRPTPAAPGFDLLTDVIDHLSLAQTVAFAAELRAPWGIAIDRAGRTPFYAVMHGACELRLGTRGPLHRLAAGDLALLPRAALHTVRSGAGALLLPFDDWVAAHPMDARGVVRSGGRGAVTRVLGAFFSSDPAQRHPLLDALPPLIVLRGTDRAVRRWLRPSLALIRAELDAPGQGGQTVLRRMADVLFIQAVRAYLAGTPAAAGALRGMGDPQVARVLALLHQQYAAPWTLGALARASAQSRTVLAERFRTAVGVAPMAYLAQWRITRAAASLRGSDRTLSQIAQDVGYRSDPVFSRAFKRMTGITPARYRRRHGVAERASHR